MTSLNMTGASSASLHAWDAVPWSKVERQVRRLQMRIAKAFREGRCHKVKALQRLLTHSRSAKVLAVRRVTTNAGPSYVWVLTGCVGRHRNKSGRQRRHSGDMAIEPCRYVASLSLRRTASHVR